MIEAPPYRPFRLIWHALVSALVVFVVWLPLAVLTAGFVMGPGEEIQFSSLSEARRQAFLDHGVAWPGSHVDVREVNAGYVIDRRWLWWSEVRLPLDAELRTDTAADAFGTGDTIQQVLIAAIALSIGGTVFVAFRRAARHERHVARSNAGRLES